MVYCNYKSHTQDSVTYAYGQTIGDMTGEVIFFFQKENGIEVVKKPEKHPVVMRQINSLYRRNRDEFKKGVFKEKLAYE